jgi:hypothetical protein
MNKRSERTSPKAEGKTTAEESLEIKRSLAAAARWAARIAVM